MTSNFFLLSCGIRLQEIRVDEIEIEAPSIVRTLVNRLFYNCPIPGLHFRGHRTASLPSYPSVVREAISKPTVSSADPFTGESRGFVLAQVCPVQEWEEDRPGAFFGQCRFEKFSKKILTLAKSADLKAERVATKRHKSHKKMREIFAAKKARKAKRRR